MMKNRPKVYSDTISQLDILKKVRGSWGSVDPRTRIKVSKKIYSRAKAKQKLIKERFPGI